MDLYKRWFLMEFFPGERLAAVPMLTEQWDTPADKSLYSELLAVEVIQDRILPNQAERKDYFQILLGDDGSRVRSVFLDSDTGFRVEPRRSKRFDEYPFADELPKYVLRG